MEKSQRVSLITKIADKLSEDDWSIIDLTLREFGMNWTDQWSGSKKDYIISMLQEAQDASLVNLSQHLEISQANAVNRLTITPKALKDLIQEIEKQKALMINVSTGGQRIQQVDDEYKGRRIQIISQLQAFGIEDPNPFPDLWSWYGKWSDGSLPSYQSRRKHITSLYQPLLDSLLRQQNGTVKQPPEPTGWERVDRNIDKITQAIQRAKNEEDFQSVGLFCREAIISLAQAVYDPDLHISLDGTKPSETDAKRMLESYIATELAGGFNEELRKHVKDSYQLAVALQHKRNASFRESALCAEATRSLVNTVAIIAGQRDP